MHKLIQNTDRITTKRVNFRSLLLALMMMSGIMVASLPNATAAPAVKVMAPVAKVSFTFDDGIDSAFTNAAPTLAKYGYAGTDYVSTSCVGMTTVPNTCGADANSKYMTWAQLTQLQNQYGWEIASHTVSHPLLVSADETTGKVLTKAEVIKELTDSKNTLQQHGFNPISFASPFGDWNQSSLAEIAKLYANHRPFADVGANTFPYNDYLLYVQQVQAGVSVNQVKGYIDTAKANNQWLVLVFHDVKPGKTASVNAEDYQYNADDLDQIAAYVKSQNIQVTTVGNGTSGGNNLLTNSGFDSSIAAADSPSHDVWFTDSASTIVRDTANNGSYPSATNSISLTGSAAATHLFSPRITVDPSKMYFVKSFLNVTSIAPGAEVGYYVDEFDAAGNSIPTGGQYKISEKTAFVENVGFEYKPTAGVASARIQVIVTAGAATKAYVDNVQFFAEDGSGTPGNPVPSGIAGDLNGDTKIDALDLSVMLSNYGKAGITATGDVNGDTFVDAIDLSTLLSNWSK